MAVKRPLPRQAHDDHEPHPTFEERLARIMHRTPEEIAKNRERIFAAAQQRARHGPCRLARRSKT